MLGAGEKEAFLEALMGPWAEHVCAPLLSWEEVCLEHGAATWVLWKGHLIWGLGWDFSSSFLYYLEVIG